MRVDEARAWWRWSRPFAAQRRLTKRLVPRSAVTVGGHSASFTARELLEHGGAVDGIFKGEQLRTEGLEPQEDAGVHERAGVHEQELHGEDRIDSTPGG